MSNVLNSLIGSLTREEALPLLLLLHCSGDLVSFFITSTEWRRRSNKKRPETAIPDGSPVSLQMSSSSQNTQIKDKRIYRRKKWILIIRQSEEVVALMSTNFFFHYLIEIFKCWTFSVWNSLDLKWRREEEEDLIRRQLGKLKHTHTHTTDPGIYQSWIWLESKRNV